MYVYRYTLLEESNSLELRVQELCHQSEILTAFFDNVFICASKRKKAGGQFITVTCDQRHSLGRTGHLVLGVCICERSKQWPRGAWKPEPLRPDRTHKS